PSVLHTTVASQSAAPWGTAKAVGSLTSGDSIGGDDEPTGLALVSRPLGSLGENTGRLRPSSILRLRLRPMRIEAARRPPAGRAAGRWSLSRASGRTGGRKSALAMFAAHWRGPIARPRWVAAAPTAVSLITIHRRPGAPQPKRRQDS